VHPVSVKVFTTLKTRTHLGFLM